MSSLAKSHPDLAVNMINDCIKIASNHSGLVFGGYVRDVIVPRLVNPECPIEFKDVDVWFNKQENADNFVKAMGGSFTEKHRVESPSLYKFIRRQYMFTKHKSFVVFFDVIVSEKYPVDDFDVNQLAYKVLDANYSSQLVPFNYSNESSIDDLKHAIHTKNATMLPGYKEIFIKPHIMPNVPGPQVAQRHLNRLRFRYLGRGWKVAVRKSSSCTIYIPQNVSLAWFKDNLNDCPSLDGKTSTIVNAPVKETTTDQTRDKIRAEALETFNAGLESMRAAFMKVLEIK